MPGSDLYLPTDPAGGAKDDSSSPWTRPWFLASAGFLALLALAALAVIIFGGGAGPDPSPSGPAEAAPGAECPDPPDGQDPAVPVQPPAAYWRLVGSAATPVSSSAGPWVTDKGHPARCFAHT